MSLASNHRLLLLVQFAVALLGALGAEAVAAEVGIHWRRAAIGLAAAGALAAVLLIGSPLLAAHSFFGLPDALAGAVSVWQQALGRAGLWLGLSAGVLAAGLLIRNRPRFLRGLIACWPVLLFADLAQAHGSYMPATAPADYYPPTPPTTRLQQEPGVFRFVAFRATLRPNSNLLYGLADIRGYDALEPRTYHDLSSLIDPINRNVSGGYPTRYWVLNPRLLNLLNVRYVVTVPGEDPRWVLDVRQEDNGPGTVGAITDSNLPGQTFVAGQDNLGRIDVRGATFGGRARGRLRFHLKTDPAAATDLATVDLDVSQLEDNGWWNLRFPPIAQARGRSFYFYFDAPGVGPDQAATLWYQAADPYTAGTRTAAGQTVAGDLAFRTWSWPTAPDAQYVRILDGGSSGVSIFENRQALPRAWLTHAGEIAATPAARLARLTESTFDPRTTVLLAAPLPGDQPLPAAPPAADADTVTIQRYAPENVEITSQSAAAGVLVLSDQAFAGWEARVDGQPRPILTVDHALRGVYLPAGTHQVSFTYAPVSFQVGAFVSVLALLAALGFTLWPSRRGQ
jgi:hypothetical protein